MTFQELLQQSTWEEIHRYLQIKYPRQIKNVRGYRMVYNKLLIMQPEISDSKLMVTNVSQNEKIVDPDVFMLEKKLGQNEYTDYSLTGVPWAKIIGLKIEEKTDKQVPDVEIITWALYIMTFYGFTESRIAAFFKKLERPLVRNKKKLKLCINKDTLIVKRWLSEFN